MVNSFYYNAKKSPTIRDKEMTDSRADQMVDRLRDMQAASADIIASSVVSVDGLTIASALPGDVEEDRVAAMSAAMLSLGERIASELGRGSLDEVYIRGVEGFVLLTAVGDEAVLTALAREEAKLGMIFLEMRRAADDLEKLV
jgi:predicted regulator of Ras-like GTPase activity (Roadblock/LC7/MglB family)